MQEVNEKLNMLENFVKNIQPPNPPGFSQPQAREFNIGSPTGVPPQPTDAAPRQMPDPWTRPNNDPWMPGQPQQQQQQGIFTTQAPQTPVPGAQYGHAPRRNAQEEQPVNSIFRPQNGFQQAFVVGGGNHGESDIMKQFKIKRKDVDLTKFNGQMSSWKHWKSKLVDHCADSTTRWRRILKQCEESPGPISMTYLKSLAIGQGYTAWDLSEDLEGFIVKYVNESIYNRRYAYTRGEEGNGFEMYRNLFNQFEGGSTLVRMGGRKLLNDYGRCPSKGDVQEYFEDWLELMGKHAPDLLTNAEEMYYRALDVLPVELEDEIVLKDDVTTYEQIHNFIIKKYAHKKHRAQQRQVIASRGRPSRMSPVVPSQETSGTPEAMPKMPSYEEVVAMTVAALQSGNQRPPKKGDRDRRPPSKDKPLKFWFDKDCWECGKNGHKRPDCPEYQALLAKNGGKRPKGHKGAFDKARDEFRRKHGARSRTPSH